MCDMQVSNSFIKDVNFSLFLLITVMKASLKTATFFIVLEDAISLIP